MHGTAGNSYRCQFVGNIVSCGAASVIILRYRRSAGIACSTEYVTEQSRRRSRGRRSRAADEGKRDCNHCRTSRESAGVNRRNGIGYSHSKVDFNFAVTCRCYATRRKLCKTLSADARQYVAGNNEVSYLIQLYGRSARRICRERKLVVYSVIIFIRTSFRLSVSHTVRIHRISVEVNR